MLCTVIRLTSTLCFLITGASVGCCQGTNPQPQAAAICGFWFNISVKDANAAANSPLCGEYNIFYDLQYYFYGMCV